MDPIITPLVTAFKDEIKQNLSSLSDELRQVIDNNISQYLGDQFEQNKKIKTLLYRNEPQQLYDIYHHLTLVNDEDQIKTEDIRDVFSKSRFVTILGKAGSGKSTLVRHLFLNCIRTNYAIPFKIKLRQLNEEENSLEEYIGEKLIDYDVSKNSKILDRLFENGQFLFFLDGYDELNSNVKNLVTSEISDFVERYNQNQFLITSRPHSDIELLPQFHNYDVKELNLNEMVEFVDKQKIEKQIKDKIKKVIKENKNFSYREFLSNPLLLTMFILKFRRKSDIPPKKIHFYRDVIDTLFIEHDSTTKLGFERELKCMLSQEEYEAILKQFCIISFFEGKYLFESAYFKEKINKILQSLSYNEVDYYDLRYDLMVNIGLLIKEGTDFTFAHRSIQEYFASLYIQSLSEKNKKRIYDKVFNRITTGKSVNIENLLSLLFEFDEVDVYKHIILRILNPLIEEVKTSKAGNEEKLFQKLYKEIRFRKDKDNIIRRSFKFRNLHIFFLFFTDFIHQIPFGINESINEKVLKYCQQENDDGSYYFEIDINETEKISELIDLIKIRDELKNFFNSLLSLKRRAEEKIEKQEKIEDEIVDII